ncbi:MAG: NUDIX domain-containing protein [Gemmatimonadota bacterium]
MTGGETVPVRVSIVDLVVARFGVMGLETLLMRRADGMRCTGAWEIVHGKIEDGETPDAAARRELREETGLPCERLYNITLGGFYLHRQGVLSLTVVFCAMIAPDAPLPVIGEEHDAYEWLPFAEAMERCAWPREREAMQHVAHLLRNGRDGGAVEDVLRV